MGHLDFYWWHDRKDPQAPSIEKSLAELDEQIIKYIAGERGAEQLELLPETLEQTTNAK